MILAANNMAVLPIWLLGCFVFILIIIGIINFLKKG